MTVEDKKLFEKMEEEIELLTAELEWYKEQFELFKKHRFGSKSEQTHLDEQMSLFDEAENEASEEADEPTVETITYERNKKRSKENLIKDLPVETIEYKLEDGATCKHGHLLKVINKKVVRKIGIRPAEAYVIEEVQYVYGCEPCEKEGIDNPIVTAPKPNSAIKGSMAAPSLIAYIAHQKYTNGMPLYRMEQDFKRFGIDLSRQNFSNWMIKASEWFEPLYDRMHKVLVSGDIIHADETTTQTLHEPGKAAQAKSYMWLYRTGQYSTPIVLYDYQTSRAGEHPRKFLKDFKGYAHLDGYAGYNLVENMIRVGCWAHAKRTFNDALTAMGKNSGTKTARTYANKGLNFCKLLFRIETKIKDLSIEERYQYRNKYSRQVLDDFSVWLHEAEARVLPKSKLGQAIQYCINQWSSLNNYLLDGRLENTNNRAERSIKPFVLGRKAWLFHNTPKGANSSAIIYSLVETAKENKIKVYHYLNYLLETLPNIDIENKELMDQLLPWSDSLPAYCKLNN
jgi:transposase